MKTISDSYRTDQKSQIRVTQTVTIWQMIIFLSLNNLSEDHLFNIVKKSGVYFPGNSEKHNTWNHRIQGMMD